MYKVSGLQSLTLLDYPGKLACTIFLSGCNFRCPFCHNKDLVISKESTFISAEYLSSFLEKRKNTLEGVCITGGEPLIHQDIRILLLEIKKLGYSIKLDTNGFNPKLLRELVEEKLVDYVAMDIKNSLEKYGETVGIKNFDTSSILESIHYLLENHIPYEFRTTVVKEFHNLNDFKEIGQLISGARAYFLQEFVDSGNIIGENLHKASKEEMMEYQDILKAFVPNVKIRGL